MFSELMTPADVLQLRPICRRYECVSFARCEVVDDFLEIECALGCTVDGQQEVIGIWPVHQSGSFDYQAMLLDLQEAGLERARFVLSWEPDVLGSTHQLWSLGATVLPSMQHLLRCAESDASLRDRRRLAEIGCLLQRWDGVSDAEAKVRDLADACAPALAERMRQVLGAIQGLRPLDACGPRVRDIVLRCDARAQELQGMLLRAVRRHGRFGSEAQALAFVQRTLERDLLRSSGTGSAAMRGRPLKFGPRLGTVRAGTPAGA